MKSKHIVNFLTAILLAVIIGTFISVELNVSPPLAIGVTIALSVGMSFIPMPAGTKAVFLKEAFLTELIEGLKKAIDGSFLNGITDLSHLVENDKIKWNKLGNPPGVTIGPVSFPLTPNLRTDTNDSIDLYPMRTDPTAIPEDELHALPYDKNSSVMQQHKETLIEAFYKWALHAFTPDSDTTQTPVMETTGDDDGTGRRRLTVKDVIEFRKRLDKIGVGRAKLVLTPDHIADLRITDQAFANQYHNIQTGQIVPMYGFEIYQNVGYNPVFDNATLTKKAYDAAPAADDRNASVAIYNKNCFKALGSVKLYHDQPQALTEQHIIKVKAYFTAGHFDDLKGNGAIIDGRV